MTIIQISATPWLASACRSAASPVRELILAPAATAKQREWKPAIGATAAAEGFAVYGMAVPAPRNDAHNRLTVNGGLKGPHPWRDPVRT